MGDLVRDAAAGLAEAGVGPARLEAEVLAASTLGCSRAALLAADRDPAAAETEARLRELVRRRRDGEPLQYLTGVQEFWSLPFLVRPGVLIPRPETEGLVEEALRRLPAATPRILDLCTGSGCVAVALARERPDAVIFACDRSRAAVEVARENARRLVPGRRIGWFLGDLLLPVRPAGFHLVAANPPYVARAELGTLPREVRDHEPPEALVAGESGLEVIERLITEAPLALVEGGALIVEIGAGQWPWVRDRIRSDGHYQEPEVLEDLQGFPRVVVATAATLPAVGEG